MTTTGTRRIDSIQDGAKTSLTGLVTAAHQASGAAGPVRVSIGDETSLVPPEVAAAIGETLGRLAQGDSVVIGSTRSEVTTGQAAQMLGISRTYVCTLVDEGVLPCRYVGTHRRIKTSDVLAYGGRRRAERRAALDELSRLTAEAGLYDDDF